MELIYIEPFKFYENHEYEDKSMRLLLSTLTVNAFLNEKIKIFTDFEGMYILSVIPLVTEIIYGNDYDEFKTNSLKRVDNDFILMNKDIFLKSQIIYTEDYIINSGINQSLIEN